MDCPKQGEGDTPSAEGRQLVWAPRARTRGVVGCSLTRGVALVESLRGGHRRGGGTLTDKLDTCRSLPRDQLTLASQHEGATTARRKTRARLRTEGATLRADGGGLHRVAKGLWLRHLSHLDRWRHLPLSRLRNLSHLRSLGRLRNLSRLSWSHFWWSHLRKVVQRSRGDGRGGGGRGRVVWHCRRGKRFQSTC